MLHARPTKWFELLVGRDKFALAMQTLAATKAAQLESGPMVTSDPILPKLDTFFAAFHALEADYAAYWPVPEGIARFDLERPIAMLEDIQRRLSEWARHADPLIAEKRASDARLSETLMIGKLVESLPEGPMLARLGTSENQVLENAIFFLSDPEQDLPRINEALLEPIQHDDGVFVVAIADRSTMAEIAAQMAAMRATPVPLPAFLSKTDGQFDLQVAARISAARERCADAERRLDALAAETGLAEILNSVAVLAWLQEHSGDVRASRHIMWITGWTDSPDGDTLRAALDAAGIEYALTVGDGEAANPPMVLDNPGWLKAFEFFPRMLGVPEAGDVDPSVLTALIAPLLFGFMFGDVGQGAILLGLGLWLSPKLPLLRMLIPGGIMAMVFGVLFGSVFSLETVIPALWLHPMHEPITVLVAALALGVVLLGLGIVMDVMQAAWHGRLAQWLREHCGLALAYFCLLGAVFQPALAWGGLVGLCLTIALAQDKTGWSPAAAGKAVAEFVESLMRLLVSTVSFARVGAFALAHAGLSAAIVGVADALGGVGFLITLAIGNAIIIGLEGLVTSIQTTRLVLFEFFIRFYRGEGREFRPFPVPRPHSRESQNA